MLCFFLRHRLNVYIKHQPFMARQTGEPLAAHPADQGQADLPGKLERAVQSAAKNPLAAADGGAE